MWNDAAAGGEKFLHVHRGRFDDPTLTTSFISTSVAEPHVSIQPACEDCCVSAGPSQMH